MFRWELLELMERTRPKTTLRPASQTPNIADSSTDDNIDTNVTEVLSAATLSSEHVNVDSNNTWTPDYLTANPVTRNYSGAEMKSTLNGSDVVGSQTRVTGEPSWSADLANRSSDADVMVTNNGSTGFGVMSTTTEEWRRTVTASENVSRSVETNTSAVSRPKKGDNWFDLLPQWFFDNNSFSEHSQLEEFMKKNKDDMVQPPGKQILIRE